MEPNLTETAAITVITRKIAVTSAGFFEKQTKTEARKSVVRALIFSLPNLSKRKTTAGKNIMIAIKEVETPRAAARPKSEKPLKSIMISEKNAATVVIAPEKIEGIVLGSESLRASSVLSVFAACSLKRPSRWIEKSIPRP